MSGGSNSAVEEIKKGVVNRLDKCGALGQIRANIRANVYRALLDPHDSGETPKDVKREAPLLLTSVVADFLKSAGMERSRETFLREAGYPKLKDHRDLAATLKCQAVEQAPVNDSVLAQVVESSRAKRGPGATGVSSTQAASKVTGSKSRGVSSDSIDIGAGIGLDRARDSEKNYVEDCLQQAQCCGCRHCSEAHRGTRCRSTTCGSSYDLFSR